MSRRRGDYRDRRQPWQPAFVSGLTTLSAVHFRDTGGRMDLTNAGANQYYVKDPFARVVVLLPAGASTSFTVEAVNGSVSNNADPRTTIGVRTSTDPGGVGLAYNQTVTLTGTQDVKQTFAITLPANTRYVELTEAAYLTGVSAPSYYIAPPPSVRRQLVVFGDSIGGGNIASPSFAGMYEDAVRYTSRFDGVDIYCVSGDTLYNQFTFGAGSIAGLASRLVARAQAGSVERRILLQIGTNDYGLDFWSAASFQTQFANLATAIHALDSTIPIDALLIPHRTTETAQPVHLSTLADFRAAQAAVVAANPSFMVSIDGFTLWSQANIGALGDGLHPNTALHATAGAILVAAL